MLPKADPNLPKDPMARNARWGGPWRVLRLTWLLRFLDVSPPYTPIPLRGGAFLADLGCGSVLVLSMLWFAWSVGLQPLFSALANLVGL